MYLILYLKPNFSYFYLQQWLLMKPFQAPNVVNKYRGEIFVQLLTVTIKHTIHQYYWLISQDKKKGITDSILVHVEYIF